MAEALLTSDRTASMIGQAQPVLERLIAKEETLAVGLLGGLARGGLREFADSHSDVDVTLLLSCALPPDILALDRPQAMAAAQPRVPDWVPNFKFTDPGSGLEFNIHQHILEFEVQSHIVWDNDKCSAYADNLQIVYDPSGGLADLVRHKTADRNRRSFRSCLLLLSNSRSLIETDVLKSLARGRPDVAGDLIVRVVHETVDVVFFLHGIWPPGHKWKRLTLESLVPSQTFPAAYRDTLLGLMSWSAEVADCLATRDSVLWLLDAIERMARKTFPDWPNDPYGHAVATLGEKQVRHVTSADRMAALPGEPYQHRQARYPWNACNAQLAASDATVTTEP